MAGASAGGTLKEMIFLRPFVRRFAMSVDMKPRLKEMLAGPPPKRAPRRTKLPTLEEIQIPARIERGPTDILKALASTVGRDYTAAHYKFHDDPYLIPYSNLSKRSYALSKEAGRKAAHWVKEQHPELFQHADAEPPIEAYFPSPVFTEDSDVTENDLKEYIQQGLVSEARQIFEILKLKGKEISQDATQSMIELLSFYNETEQFSEDYVDEKWFRGAQSLSDRKLNSWKNTGLAETLFKEVENPSLQTYCAIIRGRAKYFQADKAWELFQEVKSKGMVVDIGTYNALLRNVNFLRENAELRWALITDLLTEMDENGIMPNVGTLNTVLENLATLGNPRQAKPLILAVLSEFKKLGIEPSLASYQYVLSAFCRDRGPVSNILADILNEIEGKEFKIQDPKDTQFFVTAMDVARNHLQNVELAHRVDKLLHTGNNYDFIGDAFKESVYYRNYMALRCASEPFDEFMNFYNKIVPNIYTPEPGIFEEILKALEISTAIEYIPQLWSDMVIFDLSMRENLLEFLLEIMGTYHPTSIDDLEPLQSSKLTEDFANISWKIWSNIEGQDKERMKRIIWTGGMLGNVMKLQVLADEFSNACEVVKKLLYSSDFSGVPKLEDLKLFLSTAISQNNGAMCLACLQYVNECGFPDIKELAEETAAKVKLDSVQLVKLSNISGADFSNANAEPKDS